LPAHCSALALLCLPASVSIRQYPSAYVSIRQHTSFVKCRAILPRNLKPAQLMTGDFRKRRDEERFSRWYAPCGF
jgi:hypothetical protein